MRISLYTSRNHELAQNATDPSAIDNTGLYELAPKSMLIGAYMR